MGLFLYLQRLVHLLIHLHFYRERTMGPSTYYIIPRSTRVLILFHGGVYGSWVGSNIEEPMQWKQCCFCLRSSVVDEERMRPVDGFILVSIKVMASDSIVCHILIQNEQLEQLDMFPYLGSLTTEDGESMTEFRTRLNGWKSNGASLHKIWKSHNIAISMKVRLIKSASVACSNIRLWKLDSQKEWRNMSWRIWYEMAEKGTVGFIDSKENKWVGSPQSWSKERTVWHCQSKEASILWSHHQETRELPGERDNANNSARCTQSRKTMHGVDGQHQYMDRTPVEESVGMTED